MKQLKAILALVLVACLFVTLFAACAKNEETPNTNTNNEGTGTNNTGNNNEASGDNENVDLERLTTVVFWIPDVNNAGGVDHGDRIEKLANKITEPEGIHVDLVYMTMGDLRTKAQMDIAAGEQLDLICANATLLYNGNMAMRMDDLLNENAPELVELMADYLPATTFTDGIYAIPVLRNYVTNGYLCYNKEMLDKYGLTEQAAAVTSFTELEALFEAFTQANTEEGVYAHIPRDGGTLANNYYMFHGDSFADAEYTDTLSDSAEVVYCDDGKVTLFQAHDAYVYACEKAKLWRDNGWAYPESMFNTGTSTTELMSNGIGASELTTSEEGVDSVKTATYGAESLCVKIFDGNISTGTLTFWCMAIPTSAQEPEAAAKLLNMLYTNEALMKVMVNGEEGVDYELVNGEAAPKGNQYKMGNFVLGNNLLSHPLQGNGADFYDRVKANNDAAVRSPYMGFSIDTSNLTDYIANITAVRDQYKQTLQCGGWDEAMYKEYLGKLEAAGVYDYLAEVQNQLDAWLATK